MEEETLLGGKYSLREIIGTGGQAVVYRAFDKKLGKEWAVKEISLPKDRAAAGRERFLAECYVLKNIDCPYFPRIVDLYEEPDRVYLVMDLANGPTLEERVRRSGAVSEREALQIGEKLAEALAALHQARPPIIYLDLKPSNVILTGKDSLKLVDFGSAVISGQEKESFFMGTRGYAAPEQAAGQVTVRSDLYSLGKTLAFLVMGQELPCKEAEVRCHSAGISEGFATVLDRCMRENPQERYGSALEVKKALEKCGQKKRRRIAGFGRRKGRRWNGRQIFVQEKSVLKTEKKHWLTGFLAGFLCMGLLQGAWQAPAAPVGNEKGLSAFAESKKVPLGSVGSCEEAFSASMGSEEAFSVPEENEKASLARDCGYEAADRYPAGIVLRDAKGRKLLIRKGCVYRTDRPLLLELRPEAFAGQGETAVRLCCGTEELSFSYCSTAASLTLK